MNRDNEMSAAEVMADYSMSIWIDSRMVTLTGEDAIEYLIGMAEEGAEVNGCN